MISTHGYLAAEPPLGAADTGGQVVYVLELSKKLAELGFEVDIWTRRFGDQAEVEAVNGRVRVLRAPCGGLGFIAKEVLHESLPQWCAKVRSFVAEHGLEYAFINSHYWDGGCAGRELARTLGLPHVHTPHSIGLWKQQQMNSERADELELERRYNFSARITNETIIYSEADLVIATTPALTDMLVDDYGVSESRVRMIPPGYDDSRFFQVSEASRQLLRERLGWRGPVVLALGRLADNKGYDLLIRGFRLVADRFADARLHLAIGGESLCPQEAAIMAKLERLSAELGLRDRVSFGGFISDEELPDYYRAADCFVLSSRYEPFGMTAIEAMASGTPTVVTKHGGLWHAVVYGRDALIADPFDTADLGITISKVLELRRLAATMRQRGADRMRALFTWTGVAQQLLRAVEDRPSRPRAPALELPNFGPVDSAWVELD